MPTRRLLLAASAALLSSPALAFPDRPVRLVVPYAPGGNVDVVARLLAPGMAQQLGQPVVVENRTGAGGSLGAEAVARAAPDGHTLLAGSNGPLGVNPVLQVRLGYDPVRDFAPIAMASRVPLALLVGNALPARSLAEFVALAKARPGGLNCGSTGHGTVTHLALARLAQASGAPLLHVPFRGGGSVAADLIAGTVDAVVVEFNTALGLHRGGQARVLAIAAAARSPQLPEVPTLIEQGLAGFTAASFVGLLAPSATPAPVLAALRAAMLEALDSEAVKPRIEGTGGILSGPAERSGEGFARFIAEELARTREAAALAGLKPE